MELLNFDEYYMNLEKINEWNMFDPDNEVNKVFVYGVEDGKITKDGSGAMCFQNIEEAKETFKDLDPNKPGKKFTHAYYKEGLKGVMIFSTWEKINTYNNY